MVWTTVKNTGITATVDVDLDEFEIDQILQYLIDEDYISEKDAEMIMDRDDLDLDDDWDVPCIDTDEIATAWEYAARGDRKEALVHIERALGNEWIGRLT